MILYFVYCFLISYRIYCVQGQRSRNVRGRRRDSPSHLFTSLPRYEDPRLHHPIHSIRCFNWFLDRVHRHVGNAHGAVGYCFDSRLRISRCVFNSLIFIIPLSLTPHDTLCENIENDTRCARIIYREPYHANACAIWSNDYGTTGTEPIRETGSTNSLRL